MDDVGIIGGPHGDEGCSNTGVVVGGLECGMAHVVGQYLPRLLVLGSSEAAKGVVLARRRWRRVDIELPVDGLDVLDVVDVRLGQTGGIR
jgi:hypothetical protein